MYDANRACISREASGEQYLFMSWRLSLLKKARQYHEGLHQRGTWFNECGSGEM